MSDVSLFLKLFSFPIKAIPIIWHCQKMLRKLDTLGDDNFVIESYSEEDGVRYTQGKVQSANWCHLVINGFSAGAQSLSGPDNYGRFYLLVRDIKAIRPKKHYP